MEDSVKQEYEMVHKEIVEVRTCITEYMKMFFTLGVGVIGLFGYLAATSIKDGSHAIALTADQWAYIPLALAEIILFFASLLFHKFNTHNRGCGYMRALELERHRGSPSTKSFVKEIRLWQSALAVPFQQTDFHWGRIDSMENFTKLKEYCESADECAHPFFHGEYRVLRPILTLLRCIYGLWMIFRATIFRPQIRSWTFPFHIAFGPFVMTLFLLLTWALITNHLDRGTNIIIQRLFVAHLLISWLGLGYRMFRLCGSLGDRTIELWCWRTMVQRHEALRCDGVDVAYVGWFPKGASMPA
jgi:hypothetical protein